MDDPDADAYAASLAPGSGGLLALLPAASGRLSGTRPPAVQPWADAAEHPWPGDRAFLDALALGQDHVERLAEACCHTRPLALLRRRASKRRLKAGDGRCARRSARLPGARGRGGRAAAPRAEGCRVRTGDRSSARFEPAPDVAARYDELYPLYRELHPLLGRTMTSWPPSRSSCRRVRERRCAAPRAPRSARRAPTDACAGPGRATRSHRGVWNLPNGRPQVPDRMHERDYPFNPGHEWVGRVEETGANVSSWRWVSGCTGTRTVATRSRAAPAEPGPWSYGPLALPDDLRSSGRSSLSRSRTACTPFTTRRS